MFCWPHCSQFTPNSVSTVSFNVDNNSEQYVLMWAAQQQGNLLAHAPVSSAWGKTIFHTISEFSDKLRKSSVFASYSLIYEYFLGLA